MERLHFSVFINAGKEKVWNSMLEDKNYKEWTEAFNPPEFGSGGSYFEGEWKTGSDMLFLGKDKDGTVSGMVSRIKEARPYDFMSIEHLGMIEKDKKTMWTEEEKGPNGFFENYTLKEKDLPTGQAGGGTEVLIDLDIQDQYKDMFQDMWPKALEKLKEIAER